MSKPPKEGELKKSRQWKDKPWYYCCPETGGKCSGNWRVHKPAECEGRSFTFKDKNENNTPSTPKTKGRALKLAKAFEAVASKADADDTDTDEVGSDEE